MLHRQFITSRLSRSISSFATNTSQFFNFLAIPCMIFLEEPVSQFQFSTQTDLVSLNLICPSTCLVQLKSLRFKLLVDLLKSKVGIYLFPVSCVNLSPSLVQFSLSDRLSSDGRVNFPVKVFLGGNSLFLSANAQRLCLDLSSLSTVNQKSSLQHILCPKLLQLSWRPGRPDT